MLLQQLLNAFSMQPSLLAVNLLRGWVGRAREIGGNNRGYWVSYFTQGRDGAWCAALLYTAIETAYMVLGEDCPIKRTHSARKLVKRMKGIGTSPHVLELRPGDVVCFPRGKPWQGHVAMVESRTDTPGVYRLIDGNVGKDAKVRVYTEDLREREVVGTARLP